jgi:hypothetical protein
MKLTISGKEYMVGFAHDPFDKWTTASVYEVIEGKRADEPLYTAAAYCFHADTFSRKSGRKIALARLLDWMERKLFRQGIWEQYFVEFKNAK